MLNTYNKAIVSALKSQMLFELNYAICMK